MREIIIQWLEKASTLAVGAKLNLIATNRKDQYSLADAIQKELSLLKKIDPILGSTLTVTRFFKGGRFWVAIEKILSAPTVGFIKNPDGSVEKVQLQETDPDRVRRIRLMAEDGYTIQAIEEIEGELNSQEKEEITKIRENN